MQTTELTSTEQAPLSGTGCCPRFDPSALQDKEVVFKDELFVKTHVRSLFHVPTNMGKRVTAAHSLIDGAGARSEVPLMLSDETSAWGSDLYLRVTRDVPGATMSKLPGTYLTRVFEGPFRNASKWVEQMTEFVAERGKRLDKIYFAYTTCPACAKAYGKNYVVLFAKLRDS